MKPLCRVLVLATALASGPGFGPDQALAIRRVVILAEESAGPVQPQVKGLRDGLEELGYIEGENFKLDIFQEKQRESLGSRLGDSIQRHGVDVIVALGTRETAIAKKLTANIPIVFLPATDPIQSGFVRSLAFPEANVTGLTFFTGSENVGKQLEMFKQVVPTLQRVVALIDGRQDSGMNSQLQKYLASVAARLGIQLTERVLISSREAIGKVASPYSQGSGTGLFCVCSGLFREAGGLVAVAAKHRLPLFGCSASQVAERKALMTYAPDLYAMGYRGAWYIDRILKGVAPQALAVETPRKFEMVINRKVARDIGLNIPVAVLSLSDRVFD